MIGIDNLPPGLTIHFALDLETLSTSSPLILSMGIVAFSVTPDGKVYKQKLTAREWYLQQMGQERARGDLDTFLWWLKQSDAARMSQVDAARVPVDYVVRELRKFIDKYLISPDLKDTATFWANGVDWQWLRDTLWYDEGAPVHFNFRQVRDFRTLRKQFPLPKEPDVGTAHTALADAEWIVRDLDRMCNTYPDFKVI